jgi:hypothetical protein
MSDLEEKIRSRGYWHVIIRPTSFNAERVDTLAKLEDAFREAHVQLRGWDYPHAPREGTARHADFIEGTIDWESYHEIWRLYQSGQFVHMFGMREDWWNESTLGDPQVQPGEALSFISALYTFTEIFAFAARLTESLPIGPEIVVSYRLVGLQNRKLDSFDRNRIPLFPERRAATDFHEFSRQLTSEVSQLVSESPKLAIDASLQLFERFGWSASREVLLEAQRKLLERRF